MDVVPIILAGVAWVILAIWIAILVWAAVADGRTSPRHSPRRR